MKKKLYIMTYPFLYLIFIISFILVLVNFAEYGSEIFLGSLFFVFLLTIITLIIYLVFTLLTLAKNEDLIKLNLKVKLIHISANILLGIINIILTVALFTIGFAFLFAIGQTLIFLASSLIGIFGIYNNKKVFNQSDKNLLYTIVLLIPLFDIIASIFMNKDYKKSIDI